MIHVGAKFGSRALVPTSSSRRTRTYSQFAAEADGISTDAVIDQIVMTLRTDEMADRGRAS
jgi:hypothetical protein